MKVPVKVNMLFLILSFLTICCQVSKPLGTESKDFSLEAINHLLESWYKTDKSKDPCMDGTYKIEVSDTLKWRDFHFASNLKAQSILDRYGIKVDAPKLAGPILPKGVNIDFILSRVEFFNLSQKEPLCRQYFFSPLYAVNVSSTSSNSNRKYVIQYIMKSYELHEEALLLISFEENKFTVVEHLVVGLVWD